MLLRSIFKIGSVQILTALHGLLFTFLAARYLSPEMFGELRFALLVLPFLMVATLPTFDNIVLREAASGSNLSLQSIVKVRFIFACVGAIFLALVSIYFRDNIANELFYSLFILVLILPFYEVTTSFKNFLIGKGLGDSSLKIQRRNKFFSIILILFLVPLFSQFNVSSISFLIVFLLSTTLPNFITNYYFKLRESFREAKYEKVSVSLIKEAIYTSLASVFWLASYAFDKFVVERKLGVEFLAYYSILVMLPFLIAQLIDSLVVLFYRRIFLIQTSIFSSKFVFYLFLILTLVILFYGNFVYFFYPLIFGEFYRYSLALSMLSGLLIISGSFEFFFIQYLYRLKKKFVIFGYNLSSLLLLCLVLLLILDDINLYILITVLVIKQIFLPVLVVFFNSVYDKFMPLKPL